MPKKKTQTVPCDRRSCKRPAAWNIQTGRSFYTITGDMYDFDHFAEDGQENITLCDYHAKKESFI